MHTEVVHRQLNVQFEVLPLTEARVFLRFEIFLEQAATQEITDFLLVRLEEVRRQCIALGHRRTELREMLLHTFHRSFRVRLKTLGEKDLAVDRAYVRIGEQFSHDELIVDLFAHSPAFFIGFELLESFDLRREKEMEFLLLLRVSSPLRRISIEARVRHRESHRIL